MSTQSETATLVLTRAAESNFFEKSLTLCSLPGAFQGGPNPCWFITGSKLAGYNGVLQANFNPIELDARILDTLQPFNERKVPLTWWVGPGSGPVNLGTRLQKHGFFHSRDMFCMAGMIDCLSVPGYLNLPKIRVEEINEPAGMEEWLKLYVEGFNSQPASARESVDYLSTLSFKTWSKWHHFVVRKGKDVIAIASLFLGKEAAGLYNLVIVPSERKKGIATALTMELFLFARNKGFTIATLQTTTTEALRLYHRLGLEVYSKFGIYQKFWKS